MKTMAVWIDPHPFGSLDVDRRILGEAGIELVYRPCETEDEIFEVARDADILMVVFRNKVTRRILEALARCKVIIRHGIGLDNIDVEAATELGILVVNNTSYCIEEVSDMAMALILAATRRIPRLDRAFRAGTWDTELAKPGFRLGESTLGLLGYGRISRRVAQKAAGFGMRVLSCDPYVPAEEAAELGVALVSLDELLAEADFVSVHVPLTPETRHLVGERELRMMKPRAFLINTARGGVIDTEALVTALEDGWIAGAALDVYETFPPIEVAHPLLRLENAILTPHVAWYSEQALRELQEGCAHEAVRVLQGEMPHSLANSEVLRQPNCRVPELRVE